MFGLPLYEIVLILAALLGAGVATGILAGLFGVGGGAIVVPALYAAFGAISVPDSVRTQLCIGTSLAVIIPTSIQSFRAHRAKGAVDPLILKRWAVPVVIGVLIGGVIAKFADPAVFKIVFVCVASFSAFRLLFGKGWRLGEEMPAPGIVRSYGVLIGVLSALMGIGGGQLGSMFMTFYNRPIHQSVATSSGLGALIAIPGAISYMIVGWPQMALLPPLSVGYVSFLGVLIIAPISAVTAPMGARLAHRFNKRQLEISFGLFLLLISANFLYGLLAR
ncbi:MAG: sulfite exporter TauE/SafE family protein [Beijerinckiaceae bacterium]|nr:sulfite exporter TauE/SafE family protein [Beijerinckiaceae bacterium]